MFGRPCIVGPLTIKLLIVISAIKTGLLPKHRATNQRPSVVARLVLIA